MSDLSGKIALVTGASKGIGRGIAIALGKEGATVVIHYNNDKKGAEETERIIKEYGGYSKIIQGDLTNYKQAKNIVEGTLKTFQRIDILINNAGICHLGLFMDMKVEEIDSLINTDLKGAMYICHSALPSMISRKYGKIINLSSIWGNVGASCEVAYSAAKGGINSFTKALAKEMAPSGITVNAIAPGVIDTAMNKWMSKEEKESLEYEIPIGRFGKAEEIGNVVTFLCKDEASYITGQVITVDGGYL